MFHPCCSQDQSEILANESGALVIVPNVAAAVLNLVKGDNTGGQHKSKHRHEFRSGSFLKWFLFNCILKPETFLVK